jgi:hypothetical protein
VPCPTTRANGVAGHGQKRPTFLLSESSRGTGGAAQEKELTACFAAIERKEEKSEPASCPWFTTPSKP